jgi:hypothetical protein
MRLNKKIQSENSKSQIFEDEESFKDYIPDSESEPVSEIDDILKTHPDPETVPRSQSSALTDTLASSKPFSKPKSKQEGK